MTFSLSINIFDLCYLKTLLFEIKKYLHNTVMIVSLLLPFLHNNSHYVRKKEGLILSTASKRNVCKVLQFNPLWHSLLILL